MMVKYNSLFYIYYNIIYIYNIYYMHTLTSTFYTHEENKSHIPRCLT